MHGYAYVCMYVHGEVDILKNTLNTHDESCAGAQAAGPKAGDAHLCQWRNLPQTIAVVPQQLFC